MNTSFEIPSIQQTLINIRKATSNIDPYLVDLFDLIEDETIITPAMLKAIDFVHPINAHDVYFCMSFISETELWQASVIPDVFCTLLEHQNISTLRECLMLLEDYKCFHQHLHCLIHHANLLDVSFVLSYLKKHRLLNPEQLLVLLNHQALGMMIEALMAPDRSSQSITLILKSTCAKDIEKIIHNELERKKIDQLIKSHAIVISPKVEENLNQTSSLTPFALTLDYLIDAKAEYAFNSLIELGYLDQFNTLCAVIQSPEVNINKTRQTKLINRILNYTTSELNVFLQLLDNPVTMSFFKNNIEQIILPNHRENVKIITDFIHNDYTKSLFTGPEKEKFLQYIVTRNNGGLNTRLNMISMLGDRGFLSSEKKNLFCDLIFQHTPLERLPIVLDKFFENNLDPLTPELPSSHHPKAWEYLEILLRSNNPGKTKSYFERLTVPLQSIFPTDPPETLSILKIFESDEKYSQFIHAIDELHRLLDKNLFFSLQEQDIEYKKYCLELITQESPVLTSALHKLGCLLSQQQQLCLDFFTSPNLHVLKHILVAFDQGVLNATTLAQFMHVSEIMGAPATQRVWMRVPNRSLTTQHFNELFQIAEQNTEQDVIDYLVTLFQLEEEHVAVAEETINYAQSTHNEHTHKTVSDSAERLLRRYNGVIDQQGYGLYIAEIKKWAHSEPHESGLYTTCLSRILKISYIDEQSNIALITLLALVWIAIHDDQCRVGTLAGALDLLKEALHEIQRGYNLDPLGMDDAEADKPICAGGTFNKLMEKFTSIHPDIQVCFMSPATASLKLKHVVQEEVIKYCVNAQNRGLAELVQQNGVSEIWDQIRHTVADNMYDEFHALYPHGKSSDQFNQLIEAGIDMDISHLNLPQLCDASIERSSASSSSKRSHSASRLFSPLQETEEKDDDVAESEKKYLRIS